MAPNFPAPPTRLATPMRFLLAGAGTNLLALGAYYALTGGLGLGYTSALLTTNAASLVVSFAANKSWAFSYAGRGAFPRFVAGYAVSLCIQLAILNAAVRLAGMPHQVAVVLGLAIATAVSFLLQRHWVFPVRPAQAHA